MKRISHAFHRVPACHGSHPACTGCTRDGRATQPVRRTVALRRLHRLVVLTGVLAGLVGPPSQTASSTARAAGWQQDFEQAWQQAQRLQRPLLVHFYADWCGPCRQMDYTVLNTPEVLRTLDADFVAVKVNVDQRRDLANRFGVQSIPTDLFILPDGQVVSRSTGQQSKEAYLVQLARVLSRHQQARRLHVAAKAAPSPKTSPESRTPDARSSSTEVASRGRRPTSRTDDSASTGARARSGGRRAAERPDAAGAAVASLSPRTDRSLGNGQPAGSPRLSLGRVARNGSTSRSAPSGQRFPGPSAGATPPSLASRSTQPRSRSSPPAETAERVATFDQQPPSAFVGLEGYSPVALKRYKKWVKGSPEFAAQYQGVTFYMADVEELAEFRRAPDLYAPRLLGCDPVILYLTDRAIPGSIEYGAFFDGQLYLFASDKTRQLFKENPLRYVQVRNVLNVDEVIRLSRR